MPDNFRRSCPYLPKTAQRGQQRGCACGNPTPFMKPEEQELAICNLCPAATMNEEGDWVWANHPVTRYFHPLKDLNACYQMSKYVRLICSCDKVPDGEITIGNAALAIHAKPEWRVRTFLIVKDLWKD